MHPTIPKTFNMESRLRDYNLGRPAFKKAIDSGTLSSLESKMALSLARVLFIRDRFVLFPRLTTQGRI